MTLLMHFTLLEAQPNRPKGYLEDVLSVGQLREDGYIEISEKAYLDLLIKHRGISGAGDIVSLMTKPVTVIIDAILGTDLQNCQGCADRQQALNKAFPLTKQP